MIARPLSVTLVALAAAGCASSPCSKEQPYERAVAYPPLHDAPGVAAPAPSSEFAIPELAESVDFAKEGDASGKKACLEVPAALPRVDDVPPQPAHAPDEQAEAPPA